MTTNPNTGSQLYCMFHSVIFQGFCALFPDIVKVKCYKILAAFLKLQCVNMISFQHIDILKTILIYNEEEQMLKFTNIQANYIYLALGVI